MSRAPDVENQEIGACLAYMFIYLWAVDQATAAQEPTAH